MKKTSSLHLIGRLFLRAKRHRGWILLTMVCMVVFSALSGIRLVLIKPFTDQVLLSRVLNPALLRAEEVLDWPGLCARLAGGGEETTAGPARRLAIRLDPNLRESVRQAATDHRIPRSLRTPILETINKALKHAQCFEPADFAGVTLSLDPAPLLQSAASAASEQERTQANRRLLDAAFPGLFAPMDLDASPSANLGWMQHVVVPLADDPRWNILLNIALFMLLLMPLLILFDYLQEYLFRLSTMKIIVDFRNQVIEHLTRLSMRFFSSRKTGDLISRVSNDITVTQSALDFLFGDILLQVLMLIGAVSVAFMMSWRLSLVVFIGFPAFLWPLARLGKRIRKSRRLSLVKLGDLTQAMHQLFTGIRIVKSFEMETEETRAFAERNKDFFRQSMKVARAKALSASIMQGIEAVAFLSIIIAGGYLVVKAKYSITEGDFVTFVAACMAMNRPLKVLGKAYSSLQEALAACERVFELVDTQPEILDAPDATDLPRIERGVAFEDVSFAYETEPVLRDVCLTARPGEIVALVGPSGAGKSTLCDLICRFYDPTAGRITLDNIDLRKIRRRSLLAHLAVVSQETFLFHATIAENIRYGKRDATDAEVADAARAANIHDFVETLEEGYRTVVGERGAKLSGGQRQRIAIARAVLKDPAILILDEATSALDTESERLVQDALNRLMASPTRGRQGRITFVIAHRLSTVQRADRIIVLDAGRIVEAGNHDALLQRGGLYERLYRLQFQLAETDG
jgi:subfamily B ATP-binding cassette protein MsbA